MKDVVCKNCGLINDYTWKPHEMHGKGAWCAGCGKFIKWLGKEENYDKRHDNNKELREVWKEKGKFICGDCGITQDVFKDTSYWHLDHIIPLEKGGLDRFENTVMLCKFCHTIKHAKEDRLDAIKRHSADK
jgi:5-methylcytosine-specific restriction endonuclease McrA